MEKSVYPQCGSDEIHHQHPKVEAGADGAQDAVDEENNGKEPDENDLHEDLRFFDRLIVTAKAVESNLKYRARLW